MERGGAYFGSKVGSGLNNLEMWKKTDNKTTTEQQTKQLLP
jgi:hypothetical protein